MGYVHSVELGVTQVVVLAKVRISATLNETVSRRQDD